MLLQVMEEGTLTDARGRRVDFRNAIIVMTSNVGADTIKRGTTLGFKRPRTKKLTIRSLMPICAERDRAASPDVPA